MAKKTRKFITQTSKVYHLSILRLYAKWKKNVDIWHDGSKTNWIHFAGLNGWSKYRASKFWKQKNNSKKSISNPSKIRYAHLKRKK
jgi:hypothetical protein